MHSWIEWFTRNGVAANLLVALVAAAGFMAIGNVKQEVFPEFSLDLITVRVPYLGAAPEEVERGVCVRIEEAIQGLEGIKQITSTSSEGVGTVSAELELGADRAKLLDEIKARVDAIDTFPEEAEQPIIEELTNREKVLDIMVSGDTDEKTLRILAERLRDEILAMDGVTVVSLANARNYEVTIEVSEAALRRYGLSFDVVARAVRERSLDIPGGALKTENGDILLRTKGQAYTGLEFESLVLITRADGSRIRLGDVATVIDGFTDSEQATRFDGKPALAISVFRVGEQSVLDIAGQVKAYLADARVQLPPGIEVATWVDGSKMLRDRLDILMKNGLQGLVLVFISLSLFLRFRIALWVAVGIPVSFLGAVWLMPFLDVSVNLISLFAFIVVLGIVVDDAIIVGENIYTHQQRHGDGLRGAIEGANEVAVPVTFGILTTMAAFAPLLNVPGSMGKIMRIIPLIVIACLVFSFLESKFILPNHLSHVPARNKNKRGNLWTRFQDRFYNGLLIVIDRFYKPVLERALRLRYITLAAGFAALVATAGVVGGGWIRFDFFPAVESDSLNAGLTMPLGTPATATERALRQIEAGADALREELRAEYGDVPILIHRATEIGRQPNRDSQGPPSDRAAGSGETAHLGEVTIELAPAEIRPNISSEALARRWSELTGKIPDAVEAEFSAALFSAGKDIDLQLTGPDLARLNEAAKRVKAELANYQGVYDISDSFRLGKRELQLDILPRAEVYGLTLQDIGRQVRQAFYGEEAQRIQRNRDELRVMVRYPREERESIGDLENLRIRTPEGLSVPFSEVATIEHGRGYSTIRRVDRRRAVSVTADVDTAIVATNAIIEAINKDIMPAVQRDYPEIFYSFEGQSAEQRETMGGLAEGFLIALLMIYALLAIPLRSYFQPFLIMTAIPFGLIGAVLGHLIMGMNLTILSMFGVVALAGVVVNDSLVMVDFINRHRNDPGKNLLQAVRDAGMARFRPIMLTSITTFAGLSPLLLEQSVQAAFLIPMAVSLAFGIMFSTVITLVFLPSAYMALEDISSGIKSLFKRGDSQEEPTPATA